MVDLNDPNIDPNNLSIEEKIRIIGQSNGVLVDILENTIIKDGLILHNVNHLPKNLSVYGFADFSGCKKLRVIPEDFYAQYMDFSGCIKLTKIPKFIKNDKIYSIYLNNCKNLIEIPEMEIDILDISNCVNLTQLPKLTVHKLLDVRRSGLPYKTKDEFPNNVKINGNLFI